MLVLNFLFKKNTRKSAELNIKLKTKIKTQYPDIVWSL